MCPIVLLSCSLMINLFFGIKSLTEKKKKKELSQLNVVALECSDGCVVLVHTAEISARSEPLMSKHIRLPCQALPSYPPPHSLFRSHTLIFHQVFG